MGAGVSKAVINRAICGALKKAANELGGTYYRATRNCPGYVLANGVKLGYKALRASNGEAALLPYAENIDAGKYASRWAKLVELYNEVK